MLFTLPDAISPLRFARQGTQLKGECDVSVLPRLASSAVFSANTHRCLSNETNRITIDWFFSLYEQKYPRLQGELSATMHVLCYRCLEQFSYAFELTTDLLFISVQDEERLSQHPLLAQCEFYCLDSTQAKLSLRDVLEDEVLLALPLMPAHAVCPDNQYTDANQNSNDNIMKTMTKNLKMANNPFQVLTQIKKV